MTELVADTSALASLGAVTADSPCPLSLCLDGYNVFVPNEVIAELEEIASYDDDHGRAASTVLGRTAEMTVRSVPLDGEFPLDDGENAAVTLANDLDADLLLCDELNRLGLIHASLADTRLVTTPTLLSVLVRANHLTSTEARTLLDVITDTRSWDANSYVQRARSLLEES